MEANLALDWRAGWEIGGDRGPAIVPGDPERSLLIRAIGHADEQLKMPETRLSEQEILDLTRWVAEGAYDDRTAKPMADASDSNKDWWSLKPLVLPTVPTDFAAHPIDAFVFRKLGDVGLEPSHAANRRTLIRRVTYDLTGLPPTFEQVSEFLSDTSPTAYENLVDRLLASPRYGERWARHWFDTIHFADSHGYEHDIGRDHAWRFRDYVIQAFNNDLPWDRFIREQLAVDYFYPEQVELTPALGFLGAGPFDLSTYITAPVTFDYLDRDDLVTQTMAAFTSTTANCARCHNHKFDPITQEDYYSLQAVFSGILKGDIAYDQDPQVARERASWQTLLVACEARDGSILLGSQWAAEVDRWIDQQQSAATWKPLSLETFVSTEGATLALRDDGTILASGQSPDQDTYTVTASADLERATALRLDLFPDDSLPMRGPGRCQNGNLHLSELHVQLFERNGSSGKRVAIRNASADFNQADWGIERAIDGDPKTAWGIHPSVGVGHHAVFEFDKAIDLTSGSHICVTLRQLHGGSHTIGAFRLSLTSDDPSKAVVLPESVRRTLEKAADQRNNDDRLVLASHALQQLAEASLAKLPPKTFVFAAAPSVLIPEGEGKTMAKSLPQPKVVHVLQRGDFDKPRAEAHPGALSALAHVPSRFQLLKPTNDAQRRAALADWIAHPDNPLTWRSAVNRVWHYHFGNGICDTPSDFGRMGGVPSHTELLDWLAIWFRDEARGSLKHLHRLIVTSQTYRQSSQHRNDAAEIDVGNRLLWRQNQQRLDAGAVRDFILAVSGALDLTAGGPGVQHFKQSKGPQLTPALEYRDYDWATPEARRRSVYRFVWRGIPDPFMEAMDFPDLGLLSPTRGQSVSALQALAMYNNDFVLNSSRDMAERIGAEIATGSNSQEAVLKCVECVWLRQATPEEQAEMTDYVQRNDLESLCRVLFNSSEFLFVD